jgi:hypothetical protein
VGRILLAACTALLALAAPAGATTLVLEDGTLRPQPYQAWVDAALVPTPPGVVLLRLGGCGEEMPACAPVGERAIALSPGWASRHVLLHELGHVAGDDAPARLRARLGGEERFAEAYALCARRRTLRRRYLGGYGYAPTPARHRRNCSALRGLRTLAAWRS